MTLNIVCGKTGAEEEPWDDEEREEERVLFDATESMSTTDEFYWTPALQDNFREELEK
jgi:phosphatidylinositol 4-kinase type 2